MTPSRDKEPVFEVTGLPENVEKARQEIESHIALRTGGVLDNQTEDDFHSNGIDSGFHELNGSNDFINSMFNKSQGTPSAFTAYNNAINGNGLMQRRQDTVFNFPPINGTSKITEFGHFGNGFHGFPAMYDNLNDEGIGSPSFDTTGITSSLWSDMNDNRSSNLVSLFNTTTSGTNLNGNTTGIVGTSASRISPTSSEMSTGSSTTGTNSASHSPPTEHTTVRRIRSDPLASAFTPFVTMSNEIFAPTSGVASTTSNIMDRNSNGLSVNTSSSDMSALTATVDTMTGLSTRRHCIMCSESEVVAALVPCGHNFFCMECAMLIVEKPTASADRVCPVCRLEPSQAIRIIS